MNDQDVLKVFHGRKLCGLEILDELSLSLSQNIRLSRLVPILKRLETQDLICSEWGEELEESGGARRKYYQITSHGLKELHSSTTAEFSEFSQGMAKVEGA